MTEIYVHETGDYEGIYIWELAVAAEQYATALRRVMKVFSRPGRVSALAPHIVYHRECFRPVIN